MKVAILSLLLLGCVIHHCDCLPRKRDDVNIEAKLRSLLRRLTKMDNDERLLKKDTGTHGLKPIPTDRRSAVVRQDALTCPPGLFQCSPGGRRRCISVTWLCDGDNDCGDNSDEDPSVCTQASGRTGCYPDEFQCPDGTCLSSTDLCDGFNDCGDNSDEENCGSSTPPPGSTSPPGSTPAPGNPGCGNPAIQPQVTWSRIVNGVPAVTHSWPWQCFVGVFHELPYPYCGGSIISERYILTAAHCLFDDDHNRAPDDSITIICGRHNWKDSAEKSSEQKFTGVTSIMYEQYNPQQNNHDVAIIRLATPLTFNDHVQPVCLPSSPVDVGTKCVVTGWGNTMDTADNSVLQQLVVPILNWNSCQQHYDDLQQDEMCAGYMAGGKDSCKGDSGGPLVCQQGNTWFLYGVVSWGYECAQPNYPGVYANVAQYTSWIQQKTGVGASARMKSKHRPISPVRPYGMENEMVDKEEKELLDLLQHKLAEFSP